MKYEVHIVLTAERELDKLSFQVYTRIRDKILSLEENPRPAGAKKLTAREEYRLRVGDYRILYTIDDSSHLVKVIKIGHRGEIYR